MIEHATFANGCFWCSEAVFKRLKGVISVTSGYSGGKRENPTYEEVSSGTTGYAEAIDVEYDSSIASYEKLLAVFFTTHDPTTLNRQGNDVGTQYRSAIFYRSLDQKQAAEKYIHELEKEKVFDNPIVTEVTKFTNFYSAETYHKNYYDNNQFAPYCMFVISPKIAKLRKIFKNDLKEEYQGE